jgi:hypothetical protein
MLIYTVENSVPVGNHTKEFQMSLKKRNRLVPVMMEDIVAGQIYIRISVDIYGGMSLCKMVFHGKPFKSTTRLTRGSWYMGSPGWSFVFTEASLGDAGAVVGKQYNYHRLFRFNVRNEARLRQMVENQSLAEYLRLIGFADAESEIQKIKRDADECDYWDSAFDEFEELGLWESDYRAGIVADILSRHPQW